MALVQVARMDSFDLSYIMGSTRKSFSGSKSEVIDISAVNVATHVRMHSS